VPTPAVTLPGTLNDAFPTTFTRVKSTIPISTSFVAVVTATPVNTLSPSSTAIRSGEPTPPIEFQTFTPQSHGLSGGEMGGIVGGVLGGLAVAVVLTFAGIFLFVRSRQKRRNSNYLRESQPVIMGSFFNRRRVTRQMISGAPSQELERFSTTKGEELGFSGRLRDD
jgi:hypothetical protein